MKNMRRRPLSVFLAAILLLGVSVITAGAFGWIDITLGGDPSSENPPPPAPPVTGETSPKPMESPGVSHSGEEASPGAPTQEPPSQGTSSEKEPAAEKTPPPTDGLPAYASLYPDLYVDKVDFIEHDPEDKVVYLSFDDGPCDSTNRLLDVLDEFDVKATFFITAQFASHEKLIQSIQEMDRRGHTVAVHTYSHVYKDIYSSVEAFLADYKKMDDLIMEALGKRSGIYRFPGGSNAFYSEKIRKELLTEMNRRGFVYHDWNANNGDSEGHGPKEQVERSIREISSSQANKSVLLMHNAPGKDSVIDVLPQIIGQLKEKGYRFDRMDETVRPFQFAKAED